MWKKPTQDDLISKMSLEEINICKSSAKWSSDPVSALMKETVDTVRGFIASGRKCRMCPDESTLPAMLVGPAMDYLSYDLLTRFDLGVSEERKDKRKSAESLFEKIAAGTITPEDYDTTPSDTTQQLATAPAFSAPKPARLLD